MFEITELNLNDLRQFLRAFDAELREEKILILKEPDKTSLELNRLFLNYIFSFRTYIDHLETFLKRTFGKTSEEFNGYKQLTRSLYDGYFEYRFIYKLRNYAQHCGLPVDIFSITTSLNNGIYDVKINMAFDPQGLLEKFDGWGTQLSRELSDMDSPLDVMKLTRSFFENSRQIQQWLMGLISPTIKVVKDKLAAVSYGKVESLENLCITFYNEADQLCLINSTFRYITQMEKLNP